MKRRLFMTIFLMTLAVFAAGLIVTSVVAYRVSFRAKREEFRTEANFLAAVVEKEGAEALPGTAMEVSEAEHFRMTLISKDGSVLYDSMTEHSKETNHADREEVLLALENGEGEATRYSADQGEPTYYYARKLKDGSILRLSSAAATVERMVISMLFPVACMLAIVFVLSFLIANRVSENIVAPINRLDVSCPLERDTYPELGPLVQKINAQNRELSRKMSELREEHDKQDAMRREFTANVSHELKTPLTSISGYAEIIREGIAQEQDIKRFAGKIYDEASRLVTLVGDIIRLSQLDDREIDVKKETIDLYELCSDTLEMLALPAAQKNVTVALQGTRESICGVEQIIGEMVYNLVDNGIKYNCEGGRLTVTVAAEENGTRLSVKDTGIGIPKADLPRIFERFYRVDKSHSKEVGGTGLGLSIVKHGASYHGATVDVTSDLGKGTEVSIRFPKPYEPDLT